MVTGAIHIVVAVDDDFRVRESLESLVESAGYEPVVFSSAEDFLQSAQLDDSLCVVADVQMPAMSGLDLLTHMRTRGNEAPFIFITAFPDESVRARALKAGAICFLAKPFAGLVLIDCIESALNRHRGADK